MIIEILTFMSVSAFSYMLMKTLGHEIYYMEYPFPYPEEPIPRLLR
jgi:hypothetical protein